MKLLMLVSTVKIKDETVVIKMRLNKQMFCLLTFVYFCDCFLFRKPLDIEPKFENMLRQDEIVVIYKKTCPYSLKALETLENGGYSHVKFEEQQEPKLVEYVRAKYHKTFPAIFVRGELFGGNDCLQTALIHQTFPVKPNRPLKDMINTSEF